MCPDVIHPHVPDFRKWHWKKVRTARDLVYPESSGYVAFTLPAGSKGMVVTEFLGAIDIHRELPVEFRSLAGFRAPVTLPVPEDALELLASPSQVP